MVTAIRKAMAVAASMTASTAGWVVSAEFSAQVNCVQAHHTSQKTITACATPAQDSSQSPYLLITMAAGIPAGGRERAR
jgi:hypothetical protein